MAKCKAKTSKGKRCSNSALEGGDYCGIKYHQPKEEKKLTLKQERFCQLYVSKEFYGNGVQSYIEAYGLDSEKEYNTAKSNAHETLTNPYINSRINELLDESGLNDAFVDKQLLMLLTQNADFNSKMAAIREFNKVRGRIVNKTDHTSSDGSMSPPKTMQDWYDPDRNKK